MMPNPTVRISERSHRALKELAKTTGQPMQAVLEKAVESYRRQRFIDEANASYARLRQDHDAWASYQEELGVWDVTLLDGLPVEEQPTPKRGPRRTK